MITFEEVLPLLESESDEDNRLAVILIAQNDLMESFQLVEPDGLHSPYDRSITINRKHRFQLQFIISNGDVYFLRDKLISRLLKSKKQAIIKHFPIRVTYNDNSITEDDNNK